MKDTNKIYFVSNDDIHGYHGLFECKNEHVAAAVVTGWTYDDIHIDDDKSNVLVNISNYGSLDEFESESLSYQILKSYYATLDESRELEKNEIVYVEKKHAPTESGRYFIVEAGSEFEKELIVEGEYRPLTEVIHSPENNRKIELPKESLWTDLF